MSIMFMSNIVNNVINMMITLVLIIDDDYACSNSVYR